MTFVSFLVGHMNIIYNTQSKSSTMNERGSSPTQLQDVHAHNYLIFNAEVINLCVEHGF